eukprot:gb/GECG01008954.1/.p1 GENE.gb/GECG01008954.1/~~gb/GECG01008954.1/.p1  ORF type:complete len:225 (+),score=40.51 gb/GECG01008954.1/:1-675(+)
MLPRSNGTLRRRRRSCKTRKTKKEKITRMLNDMQEGRHERQKQWYEQRRAKETAVRESFKDILLTRGSWGRIDMEHGEEEKGAIQVAVIPDASYRQKETNMSMSQVQSFGASQNQFSQQQGKGTEYDLGTLSGGEKSYTTLALLGSFDTVVDCPFRIMDEFDVFMDDATRKLAVKALLKMASQNPSRQYICITPHDVKGILRELPDQVPVEHIRMPSERQAIHD